MTYQELLNAALRMVCEGNYIDSYTKDYSERAPYIFASFLSHCAPLEARYRRANGLEDAVPFEGVTVALSETVTFPSVFTTAAIFYLSAMLPTDFFSVRI